jgi:hypothetical protein
VFGAALASGDVDGDGVEDLLVGSPSDDYLIGSGTTGRVDIWYGGGSLSSAPDATIPSPYADGEPRFGASIAVMDVDADGRGDVVVGAPFADGEVGAVHLFASTPGDLVPAGTWAGVSPGERFGSVLAAAGDLDGNGRGDLVVGAPAHDAGRGRAALLLVQTDGAIAVGPEILGEAHGDGLGAAVAGGADLNDDGFADVVVGAPEHDGTDEDAGRVYVLQGGPAPDAVADYFLDAPFPANDRSARFGSAVALERDLDGDGVVDLVVGSDHSGSDDGAALVYRGGSVPGTTPVLALRSGGPDGAGAALACLGDGDADGRPEILVGAPHSVFGGGRALWIEARIAELCPATAVDLPPAPVRLDVRIRPNPFNPRCTVQFRLKDPGPVRVEVFDLAGRRVRILADARYPAGTHELTLEPGEGMASGVYLVRVVTQDETATARAVLVK